uniref:uncharacterized protein LOC122588309 n=1 Tax=Erigeron canadensis TaxID=72917 RepID=UPI001CB8D359|nr:uncharacterized protein LOC122588309 [Erigeron canadensis]
MRKNVKWTIEEVEALLDGMKKHGRKWVSIIDDPQFATSLANRSNIDLKKKTRGYCAKPRQQCDGGGGNGVLVAQPGVGGDDWSGDSGVVRQDYLKSSKEAVVESNSEYYHTPCATGKRRGTSSFIEEASKPRAVEELSESKGYHNSCTFTRQRRWTRNSIISEVMKIRSVKELSKSQEYLKPCTIACQRRGTHDNMINQTIEESALKELRESQEHLDPCTIALQRRGTHDNMINQPSNERVVEELSDSKNHPNPCIITYRRQRTCDKMTNRPSNKRVVEELSDSKNHLNPCTINYQRQMTRDNMTNQAGEERVVEERSDFQDYQIPCTITCKRRSTPKAIISEASSKSVVKELNESGEYLKSCLSTLQRRVTCSIVKKQADKEIVVEDISDSKDYHNRSTIAWQRRSTRSSMVNQTREESVIKLGTCNSNISHSSKIRVVEELSDSQDYHNPYTIARQTRGTRRNRINQAKKLDSEQVHSYLEKIWVSFAEDRKSSFTCLDPLWFAMYLDDFNKEKVLNWIRKKDIFSKTYVIFPIVKWGHWSVLIFCHFGESIGSRFNTPCIVFLDSLEKAGHSQQLEPIIRKFVLDIYKNAQRTEDIRLLRKMPFLVPKVPQQRDGVECGFFVLYYIKLFVENAPESFSISDGYPYFMSKDWFSCEGLDSFFRTFDTSHNSI